MERALEQVGETMKAAGEWTAEKAEDFYKEVRDAVDGFRRDMDEIKADPPEGEELRKEWNKMVEDLNERIDGLNEDLEELKDKTGEAREEMLDTYAHEGYSDKKNYGPRWTLAATESRHS